MTAATTAPDDVTAATHTYATLDVPVAGGRLRVGVWDPVGPPAPEPGARPDGGAPAAHDAVPTVLAVHGITASHRAWPAVVAALPSVPSSAATEPSAATGSHTPTRSRPPATGTSSVA